MDRYELNVVTLSSHSIKEKIDSVPDPDRLTTICVAGNIDETETYNTADVIFLSYSQAIEKIQLVLDNKAKYATIILLVDNSVTETLNEDLLEFDLWDTQGIIFTHRIKAFKKQMLANLDLELTTNQLNTLIDSVPDLIWYKDFRGSHIKVNNSFCKTVNKTKEQIQYRGHCYIWDLDPEEYEQGEYVCMETEDVVLEEQKTFLFDEKVKISDEMRQLKTYKSCIIGRHGESLGTVGIARDVTEIWNTQEEFRILISRLPFPMIILDKDYHLLSCNSHFDELFSYSQDNHDKFEIGSFGEQHFKFDIASREHHNTSVEKTMMHNGEILHLVIEKSEITDVFGELSGFFYIFRNVTKTRQYEAQLKLMAETDELTQINNRKAIRNFYETKLPIVLQEKLSLSLILIDIDYFKLYNDTYGHLDGDEVIKVIASILDNRSDNDGILAGRFGGEEFLLITINKTQDEVSTLVDLLMNDLKDKQIPHKSSKVDSVLTMSIGVIYYHQLPSDLELTDVINSADKALYQAKHNGRNGYVFDIQ